MCCVVVWCCVVLCCVVWCGSCSAVRCGVLQCSAAVRHIARVRCILGRSERGMEWDTGNANPPLSPVPDVDATALVPGPYFEVISFRSGSRPATRSRSLSHICSICSARACEASICRCLVSSCTWMTMRSNAIHAPYSYTRRARAGHRSISFRTRVFSGPCKASSGPSFVRLGCHCATLHNENGSTRIRVHMSGDGGAQADALLAVPNGTTFAPIRAIWPQKVLSSVRSIQHDICNPRWLKQLQTCAITSALLAHCIQCCPRIHCIMCSEYLGKDNRCLQQIPLLWATHGHSCDPYYC